MARDKRQCIVAGCERFQWAKGWCRRHYGQMYRYGRITDGQDRPCGAEASGSYSEELGQCHKQLAKAQADYELVTTLAGRIYWRREIEEIEARIMEYEARAAQAKRNRAACSD